MAELKEQRLTENSFSFLLFRTLELDASQGSLVTIVLDDDDLMCADPELGQRALRNTINRVPDGTVILLAHQRGINVDADVMIVRDRLQRYHMRRQFGPKTAPWHPERDELQVSSHESTRNSSMAESNASLGPSAEAIHSPLPTGQSMGPFRGPMSMMFRRFNLMLKHREFPAV